VGDNHAPGGPDARMDGVSYLTFSLKDIPPGSTITAATLFIEQDYAEGVGSINPINIDHVRYSNIFDTTTQASNRYYCNGFGRGIIQSNFYNFTVANGAGDVWHRIPCTSQVQYSINNPVSWVEDGNNYVFQIRLRDNGNGTSWNWNEVRFYANNAGTAHAPYLKVYYGKQQEMRGFLSFNLNNIPDTALVTSATLCIYRNTVHGTPGDIQPIYLDHIDYGTNLNSSDFNTSAIESGFANFNTANAQWGYIDVTSQVSNAFVNEKSWIKNGSKKWFQIRIRPGNVNLNDSEEDSQSINSADDINFKPYLKISYTNNIPVSPPDVVTNIVQIQKYSATNIIPVSAGIPKISIIKSISNVRLKNQKIQPIPGGTMIFKIEYTNSGNASLQNALIYDKIPIYTKFLTNSAISGGWIVEYSTNTLPDQSYNSSYYTTLQPSPEKIKWIRWKKTTVNSDEKGEIFYSVIIK